MTAALWFTVAGLLLVGVALAISTIQRLPLTTALIYLCIGWLLGPEVLGLLALDALNHGALLERLTEIVVIVSLFSVGLKLRVPIRDRRWRTAFVLAFGSMTLTVALVTIAGVYLLGLPVGGAVLLGAVMAPTDPVLASDVQVGDPFDRDPLRFSLTGEAGLNDGTAFPFVMLGLGLLHRHRADRAVLRCSAAVPRVRLSRGVRRGAGAAWARDAPLGRTRARSGEARR